jgi:hypothetical protein
MSIRRAPTAWPLPSANSRTALLAETQECYVSLNGGAVWAPAGTSAEQTKDGSPAFRVQSGSSSRARRSILPGSPACVQAYASDVSLRPSRAWFSLTASHRSGDASSPGKHLRAASSSSGHGALDRYCCRERVLARFQSFPGCEMLVCGAAIERGYVELRIRRAGKTSRVAVDASGLLT